MKSAYRLFLLATALCLSACGGGGSGSSSGSGSSNNAGVSHFTVGGSISGLTALSGAVLLDNGTDALTVPANATSFTFATPLNAGSDYAVTLQAQPDGETCTVNNGSGPANANITDVSIACVSNFSSGGSNVVDLSIAPGPGNPPTFNIPLVSVTVCGSSGHCATIPDVLVDTGSAGLRLMASVLTKADLSLPATTDAEGDSIHECMQFADGDAWGTVSSATVSIGGETTASAVPLQVIDDSGAQPPSFCQAGATKNSINAFDANGVLGVGVYNQDCGSACVEAGNTVYYACNASGSCASTPMPTGQVANPVPLFPKDNNGVIVQFPDVAAAGAAGASGYLVFGIDTENNNALPQTATVLQLDASGEFTTMFGGMSLANSLIDSGSNALYFPSSPSIATCPASGAGPDFYCPADNPPSSPLALSATNQGSNGTVSSVNFGVADLDLVSPSNFAIPDVGGPPATDPSGTSSPQWTNYFDWGLPFFYGRTVFVAIRGSQEGGPNGAYAY